MRLAPPMEISGDLTRPLNGAVIVRESEVGFSKAMD